IFAQLMEMFDERQNIKDLTEKFVHASEIELVYLKAANQDNKLDDDPVWEMWQHLEKTDSRNLSDKIKSVCNQFNGRKIQFYSQKVARSLIEQQRLTTDKSVLAVRYRIFEHCRECLQEYLE